MEYVIRTITEKEEIESCDAFSMNYYLWNSIIQPAAYGKMGYIKDKGLYLMMTCEEKEPKRVVAQDRVNVSADSAMECFLAFTEPGEELSNDSMHLNFEVNANGALYAKYGKGRKNRQFASEDVYREMDCKADIEADRWHISLLIPEHFITGVLGGRAWRQDIFYCNFTKISESAEIEHYGSYADIGCETPNFHLPIYYAQARIVSME